MRGGESSVSSEAKSAGVGRRVVRSHRELEVYKRAMDAAMDVFWASRAFPKEEVYSLTSQILRSTQSVAANITGAWRKRRYEAAFVAKLSDAEAEAAETQTHLEFAVKCGYLKRDQAASLYRTYEGLIKSLVVMIVHADRWTLPSPRG